MGSWQALASLCLPWVEASRRRPGGMEGPMGPTVRKLVPNGKETEFATGVKSLKHSHL